jgi:fatty aldehyde-generating acyl-ACP reductase
VNPVEFALLGHQETWDKISLIFHALREPRHGLVSTETLRELVPWIPPRTAARATFCSYPSGQKASGVYVETFITPDELSGGETGGRLAKVEAGIRYAAREGARVVALGGFTSILLEAKRAAVSSSVPALTTGNTLTAAYIVKGVERAARQLAVPVADSTILVIGATGDIGSACVRYFGPRARKLLLAARGIGRLRQQLDALHDAGIAAEAGLEVRDLAPRADIVIAAASVTTPTFCLHDCRPHTLVCDAGYPKNIVAASPARSAQHVFWGGLGQVRGGWTSESNVIDAFYRFPVPSVAHGCLLEGVLLALEGRYESFSQGRGNITSGRIDEIWAIAQRHGFVLAPFFNGDGLWPEYPAAQAAYAEATA